MQYRKILLKPYIQANVEPNIERNIEPNIQHNIECNIQPNIETQDWTHYQTQYWTPISTQYWNQYCVQYWTKFVTQYCSAWPRLKLNTKVGLHTTTSHHPPTTTTQTHRQQYPSCYWPDLDQTLNKGSLEHLQQNTTVTTTFVQGEISLKRIMKIWTYVQIIGRSCISEPYFWKKKFMTKKI